MATSSQPADSDDGGQQQQQHHHHQGRYAAVDDHYMEIRKMMRDEQQQQQHHHQGRYAAVDDHHMEIRKMMRDEQSYLQIPPGWRFRPTDQELITDYLIKKISNRRLPLQLRIIDLNLYEYTPMELAARFQLPEDPTMYFFTPRERKYPRGGRPSRITKGGFWKATGQDKPIENNGRTIGHMNSLVFYAGKPKPDKQTKTNWIMKEYTIRINKAEKITEVTGDNKQLDKCVLCKVYETTENKQRKGDEANTVSVDDDKKEKYSSAPTPRLQAQEDQALPLLRNPLPPPPNIISGSSSFSNLAGQYNMSNHNAYAFNNGSFTQYGSFNGQCGSINGFGVHQKVTNLAPMSHVQQDIPFPLLHSTDMENQGGNVFHGSTTYQFTQSGFGAQSLPIYNDGSLLDNIGYGMDPMDATENQSWLDEPLPDFGFLVDDIDEGVSYGMPIEYAKPVNSVPPITSSNGIPDLRCVTQSTEADRKSSTTPTDYH